MQKEPNYFIAVDFDGTLCRNKFPEIGNIRRDVARKLSNHIATLTEMGYKVAVILWTCRSDLPERAYLTEAINWWKDNGYDERYFPIECVNDNPYFNFGHPELVKKIFAHEYWDDRAVEVR